MAYEQYSYVLTETALNDLDETYEYNAVDLANPDAAGDFADELEEKLTEICKAPRTGRPVINPYLKRKDIRRFLVKNYIGYYLVEEDTGTIVVLRIVYGKRNQDKILKTI